MQKQTTIGGSQGTNEKGKETRSTDIPGCIRRLSTGERMWLWSLTANVAATARIIGDIEKENLLRAINAARQMHPLLGARIIFDDQHDAWFSTDNVPKTIFRTVPRRSETQWIDEMRHEYLIPFEPETGPLIRFVLVHSRPASELIVFTHHSICDGMALANLIRDILVFYTEPVKEVQIIHPPSGADYLPHEHDSLPNPVEIEAINSSNFEWRKNPHNFTQADFNEVHKAYWEKYRYNMVLLQLGPEETSVLVNKCREKGVTIISASTAAFMAAYGDVVGAFPNNKNNILIAYDLRRHLGKDIGKEDIGNVFCYFAKSFYPSFEYNQEKLFWENIQGLHAEIRKGVERLDMVDCDVEWFDPTLISALSLAFVVQLVPEVFEKTKNLSAFIHDTGNIVFTLANYIKAAGSFIVNTNLGRLDLPETYGNLKLDRMFFMPPADRNVPLTLGGVGINGRLVFTLNYVEDACEDGLMAGYLIRIRNRALEYLGFPEKANDKTYDGR